VLRIKNLAGLCSGEGFVQKLGRRPTWEDASFRAGPLDLLIADDGKIVGIEGTRSTVDSVPSFDASDLFATAAFTDSHTHALFAGSRAAEYFMRWEGLSYREIAERGGGIHNTMRALEDADDTSLLRDLSARLEAMARSGSTCVEVKSGYASSPQGELRLLRLLTRFAKSGQSAVRIKRSFLGLHALPKGASEGAFVDSMIALLDTIRDEGLADFIDAFPDDGFFSLEQSLRFAREGMARGLRPKIHADELAPFGSAENFAAMGALSVDHLQKISHEGVESLAQSPTIATLLPATSFFLGLEYSNARKLIDAGARVALATDFNPGTAPELSMPFTLRLAASQLRMSAAEILCAATLNGAAAIGEDATAGALLPGYRGDVLLWRAQGAGRAALEEIMIEARSPEAVFIGGRRL
jgi:imidazolonepropionase